MWGRLSREKQLDLVLAWDQVLDWPQVLDQEWAQVWGTQCGLVLGSMWSQGLQPGVGPRDQEEVEGFLFWLFGWYASQCVCPCLWLRSRLWNQRDLVGAWCWSRCEARCGEGIGASCRARSQPGVGPGVGPGMRTGIARGGGPAVGGGWRTPDPAVGPGAGPGVGLGEGVGTGVGTEQVLEWGQVLDQEWVQVWGEVGRLQTLQWGLVQGQVLDREKESQLALTQE